MRGEGKEGVGWGYWWEERRRLLHERRQTHGRIRLGVGWGEGEGCDRWSEVYVERKGVRVRGWVKSCPHSTKCGAECVGV